jgi:hypothetical protein
MDVNSGNISYVPKYSIKAFVLQPHCLSGTYAILQYCNTEAGRGSLYCDKEADFSKYDMRIILKSFLPDDAISCRVYE